MAGGVVACTGDYKRYNSQSTRTAFFCCLIAASGGALFGYGFLEKFFPHIAYAAQHGTTKGDLYCTFNNQVLQLMTSGCRLSAVLFLAGAVCEITGTTAWLSRNHGRKKVMLYSGVAFMLAALILAVSYHISMIIIGRILQGIAISFASVSVPIYNSEMAPPHLRGRFNQLFQVVLTFFILVAQVINLIINVTHATHWGWRLSLGCAFFPSAILFFGGLFLPDSPNSLLERGFPEEARRSLELVRGTKDVDEEYNDLKVAAELAATVKRPWRTFFSKKYLPQVILCSCSTLFQQWTGINIIIFYAPQIFLALGMSSTLALVAGVIIGACNHLSTYISTFTADHFGRRPLFIVAGFQMAIALLTICLCLHFISPDVGNWLAWFVLVLLLIFDNAYAWSYGPLAWLYPSEISPLEIRSCGLAAASFMNLLFSFVIAQTFLTMLCSLKAFTFLFFCICVIVMTTLVYFLFVETKNVPIEYAPFLFRTHPIWKSCANSGLGLQERVVMEKKIQECLETGTPLPDDPAIRGILRDMQLEGHLDHKQVARLSTDPAATSGKAF